MSQFKLLIKTISFLNDEKIPYMLVGSFVSSIYGDERTTQDIDLVSHNKHSKSNPSCFIFLNPLSKLTRTKEFSIARPARYPSIHSFGKQILRLGVS